MIIFGVIFVLMLGWFVVECSMSFNPRECFTISPAIAWPLFAIPLALFFLGLGLKKFSKKNKAGFPNA